MSYTILEQPRKGSIDDKGVRRYTRTFLVTSTYQNDSPGQVVTGVLVYYGIALYSAYVDDFTADSEAFLKKAEATQRGDLSDWIVTLEYDSQPNAVDRGSTSSTPGAGNQTVSPESRPVVIKMGSVDKERILDFDYDTPPVRVLNSADCPFDPPISLPVAYTTISLTLFKTSANYAKISTYKNAINNAEWVIGGLTIPARYARCTDYQQTSVYEHGAQFWEYQITVEISPDIPYNPVKVLDAGTMLKPGADAANPDATGLRPIKDKTGQPVTQPVPLDGAGKPLRFVDDPVYLEFMGYREEDFDSLY